MADDPATGIEIVGALSEAGLLRTAPVASEPAAQVIRALGEAGLLRSPPTTAGEAAIPGRAYVDASATVAAPPPPPEPTVDQEVYLGHVTGILVSPGPTGSAQITLTNSATLWKGNYMLDFPPNHEGWLPELNRITAAPRGSVSVSAGVKVTKVSAPGYYLGKLYLLRAQYALA
jgi:hypothetical protein